MKFYSEKLNKLFETEKELIAAEKELADKEAKKAEAAKEKKAEALKVEEAFKARNAARRTYNDRIVEAKKVYNTILEEAKKAFNDAVTAATKEKDAAEKIYDAALKEFTTKHPEGYHMTLKDGDNVVTISSQGEAISNIAKEYNQLLDLIFGLWK